MDKYVEKRGRDTFRKFNRIISFLVRINSFLPSKIRLFLFEHCRNIKGKFGLGVRYVLFKSLSKRTGENVAIYPGCYIFHPQNIVLGNNVSIHPMTYIEPGSCGIGISIGNDVSIAHGVSLIATTHTYTEKEINIRDAKIEMTPIRIEDNVWVGAKATILTGVSIASGCVIGANSVVTRNTQEDSVYVGAPARKIKSRF